MTGEGFGQRTTASGSARYDRARADEVTCSRPLNGSATKAHFYQTAMLSVLTGITRAALRDGVGGADRAQAQLPAGTHRGALR